MEEEVSLPPAEGRAECLRHNVEEGGAVSVASGLDLTEAAQDEDVAHFALQGLHEFLGFFGAARCDVCDEPECLCRGVDATRSQEVMHVPKGIVVAGNYRGAHAFHGATRRLVLLLFLPQCLLVDLLQENAIRR